MIIIILIFIIIFDFFPFLLISLVLSSLQRLLLLELAPGESPDSQGCSGDLQPAMINDKKS